MSKLDLQKYCETDGYRPYLSAPFSFGAYTYATNGHIILRVDRREDAAEGTEVVAKVINEVFRSFDKTEFRKFPPYQFPPIAQIDCEYCGGSGKETDGSGLSCGDCDGTGKTTQRRSVSVYGSLFDVKYIEWLLEFPSVEIEFCSVTAEPMKFRFDGGSGALMPLRSPYTIHFDDIAKLTTAEARAI